MSTVASEPTRHPDVADPSAAARYALVLFVTAGSASSARALRQVRALCDKHLAGQYSLALVDVNREPELVPPRVLATPTLLRRSPTPELMVVGNFSDEDRVLAALGIAGLSLANPSGAPEAGPENRHD